MASQQPSYAPQPNPLGRVHHAILLVLIVLLPVCLLLKYFGIPSVEVAMYKTADASVARHPHSPSSQITIFSHSNQSTLVPLEAHIMSKCPDARDCLRDLVVPAMEKISDHVNFQLSFIGSVNADDTVQCKHGATECLGNMLSLCADNLHPNDPVISLGFTNCLVSSYSRIPSRDLVESCSLEHGISFDELNSCVSEEGKGLDLLSASIERSQKAGVQTSCTVRVRDKVWCVRDGGEWKNCDQGHDVDDLVAEILDHKE